MTKDPRPWFPIDHDLWREPDPLKLRWWERKIAIYLRKCSGPDPGDKSRPNIVLRPLERIATDTDLTITKVEKAISRFRQWPSRRRSFIKRMTGTEITLRPLPSRFVKCPVWLWESPFPDDFKDILLFVRSRFAGKEVDGRELYDCNLFGTKQPSIYRCCYLAGTGYKGRRKRLQNVVSVLVDSGLLVVKRRSTSKTAMVVADHASEPTRLASEAMSRMRSAQQDTSEVHSKPGIKCIAGQSEVHSKPPSSAYTPESFLESSSSESLSKSFSDPSPAASGGEQREGSCGNGSKEGDRDENWKQRKLVECKNLTTLLEKCCKRINLPEGDMPYARSASNLAKALDLIKEDTRRELLWGTVDPKSRPENGFY